MMSETIDLIHFRLMSCVNANFGRRNLGKGVQEDHLEMVFFHKLSARYTHG
jgi:hypothetical protein